MRIYTGAYFPDFKSRIIASNVTVAFFSAIIIYIIRCKNTQNGMHSIRFLRKMH